MASVRLWKTVYRSRKITGEYEFQLRAKERHDGRVVHIERSVVSGTVGSSDHTEDGLNFWKRSMFGVVPGNRYGWPKNILHWSGIQQSILDICATVPVHFVIADAIMAMEGNGPLNGTPRPLGSIVLADDAVAADATCARLMGLEPARIVHIHEAAKFLSNSSPKLIDQVGEMLRSPDMPFQVVPEFRFLSRT